MQSCNSAIVFDMRRRPMSDPNDKQKCVHCGHPEHERYCDADECTCAFFHAPRGGATAPLDGSAAEVKRYAWCPTGMEPVNRHAMSVSMRWVNADAYEAVVAERDEARRDAAHTQQVLRSMERDLRQQLQESASRVAELERVLKEARIVVRHAGDGPTTNALVARIDAALSGAQPTEYPKGAASVVKPQGTEETGNDRPAAPISDYDRCGGSGWIEPHWPVGPNGTPLDSYKCPGCIACVPVSKGSQP